MEPLRIRCRPTGLFVYPEAHGVWVHLDSLLLRAVLLDRRGYAFYLSPPLNPASTLDELDLDGVPLVRRERGGQWYFACSWANVTAASYGEAETAWIRGYPDHDAMVYLNGPKRLLIKTWQGPDKLYNMPVHTHITNELIWYAVGDRAEVERLLTTYYHAIGKKSAYGQGQLAYYEDGLRWQVEPWPADWSERDGDGHLTRGIPAEVDGGFPINMIYAPLRPPYYLQANHVFLVLPDSEK